MPEKDQDTTYNYILSVIRKRILGLQFAEPHREGRGRRIEKDIIREEDVSLIRYFNEIGNLLKIEH